MDTEKGFHQTDTPVLSTEEKDEALKNLKHPHLGPAHIKAQVIAAQYWVPPGTAMTICVLTLQNGFHVVGHAAPADAQNFNKDIGERIAYDEALRKIWPLEGYVLRNRLFAEAQRMVPLGVSD